MSSMTSLLLRRCFLRCTEHDARCLLCWITVDMICNIREVSCDLLVRIMRDGIRPFLRQQMPCGLVCLRSGAACWAERIRWIRKEVRGWEGLFHRRWRLSILSISGSTSRFCLITVDWPDQRLSPQASLIRVFLFHVLVSLSYRFLYRHARSTIACVIEASEFHGWREPSRYHFGRMRGIGSMAFGGGGWQCIPDMVGCN